MNRGTGNMTVSIRVTVLSIFLLVVCFTVSLVLGLQYYFSSNLARTAAEQSFIGISERVSDRIDALDRQSANLVNIFGNLGDPEEFSDSFQNNVHLPLFAAAMEDDPSFYSIYIGCKNGDFFEVTNLESSESVRRDMSAAPNDRWVSIKIYRENGKRIKLTSFFDGKLKLRATKRSKAIYNPTLRPWYIQAVSSSKIIKTRPYMFSYIHSPGITYAKKINNGNRVVAVDISLASMTRFLKKQRLLPGSEVFLFQKNGDVTSQAAQENIISAKDPEFEVSLNDKEKSFLAEHPYVLASNELNWPPFDFAMRGHPKGYSIDLLNLLASRVGLNIKYVNGHDWGLLVDLFKKGKLDILHSLFRSPERDKMGIFTPPYLPMPQVAATLIGGENIKNIADLRGKTVSIPLGWETANFLQDNYPDIKLLKVKTSLDALRAVQSGKAYATLDSAPVLNFLKSAYFLDKIKLSNNIPELSNSSSAGLHFLTQFDKPELASILVKAMGTLTKDDYERLDAKWLNFDDLGKGRSKSEIMGAVPHPQFLKIIEDLDDHDRLHKISFNNQDYFGYVSRLQSIYGNDEFLGFIVPVAQTLKPYMAKVRFSFLVTITLLLLLAPLVWFSASLIVQPVKALMHESVKVKERRYEDVGPVASHITEIVDLSASMVDMAFSIQEYEQSTHNLMDAFVRLIATAIDHKSPYTGGHCERVPVLAIMIGKAANEESNGAFADFKFSTADEWREFRIAAWLHDCGKVTTPEHIVDKATKLETIYNRIHEVRMRFEVLLRDAEIDYWRKRVDSGHDEAKLCEELAARKAEIKDDFVFIAECNQGSEFMDDDKIKRIHRIAKKTWIRYLDNRLGLGHLEKLRYPEDCPELPCEEPLLADRPEHIYEHRDFAPQDGVFDGFAMETPEHLYNLGEIYNLCIQKGTLTAEDRYKINEHIIATIHMLEKLPYPSNLTRIPEYAGTHHETLIGTGYPRKLKGDEISIPGRILAVADVFEALTASDRPYKKAKKLSEAIEILSTMVKDNHLDANVFRLFLKKGIYKVYADRFLQPEQIDEIDIEKYLGDL